MAGFTNYLVQKLSYKQDVKLYTCVSVWKKIWRTDESNSSIKTVVEERMCGEKESKLWSYDYAKVTSKI